MHIALIQRHYQRYSNPRDLIKAHFTILNWASALADKGGLQVTVIYRFNKNYHYEENDINYYFFQDRLPPSIKWFHLPFTFASSVNALVKREKIDLVHYHDLNCLLPNYLASRIHHSLPVVIQDHGAIIAGSNRFKSIFKNYLYKWCHGSFDAALFSAEGQEVDWISSGILEERRCYFVMENYSDLRVMNSQKAKRLTKMHGTPVCLWVGNLDSNKDPLTVLRAFINIVGKMPDAKLYMIYRSNTLEYEVKQFIELNTELKDKVILLGERKREELNAYYSSSDYFISASHKEGSGYSAIEAISCGVIPILTRIPSFMKLTFNESIGQLFEVGNAEMLFEKFLIMQAKDMDTEKNKVINHFKNFYSEEALARTAKQFYLSMINKYTPSINQNV